MPHTITWSNQGFTIEFMDEVTSEEFIRAKNDLIGDPRYFTITYYIVDLLNVTVFSVSPDAVREIAKKTRKFHYAILG